MNDFQKFLDENLGSITIDQIEIEPYPQANYDIYSEIRNAIKQLRRENHLTQKELASKAGLTQANLSNLESGETKPTIDSLKRIADATGTRLVIDFMKREAV
ncbi:MAG: helix-turn-helix transcriptional regulator [Lachnospiraceae bacterium]|nr:helix-turn-helix transcriptional regulator [Lachnospiraceae bacterium]